MITRELRLEEGTILCLGTLRRGATSALTPQPEADREDDGHPNRGSDGDAHILRSDQFFGVGVRCIAGFGGIEWNGLARWYDRAAGAALSDAGEFPLCCRGCLPQGEGFSVVIDV